MLDVLCVFRWLDRWDDLVERDLNAPTISCADRNLLRRAVQISRRAAPLLTFAAVHRKLYGVSVRPLKRFISMKQTLYPVVTWLQIRKSFNRIAKGRGVDHRRL